MIGTLIAATAVVAGAGQDDARRASAGACAKPLVAITDEGAVSHGAKSALIEAVQAGRAIRVGFGLGKDESGTYVLTHWFEAHFLTVFEGEVFTQTPFIHRQRPSREEQDVLLTDEPMRWVATMGTNGKLHSRFLEAEVGDHRVDSWWCLAD